MADFVTIVEMSPRDGLQNENIMVPTDKKIDLVNRLSDCGFLRIETTSFVSPKWVPQMADAADVAKGITRKNGVVYSALTPNMHGYAKAMEAGIDEVAIFASASEGFSQKNINCSIKESITRFLPIIRAAYIDKIKVRGYVSCITDCPYDGPIGPESTLNISNELLSMGCFEVSLGDTIGASTPTKVESLLGLMVNQINPTRIAGHFHDTNGYAIENIRKSLEFGLRTFDSSVGGLGGCPYANGAKGNVDTIEVVRNLADWGFETGLDFPKLLKVAEFAKSLREPKR